MLNRYSILLLSLILLNSEAILAQPSSNSFNNSTPGFLSTMPAVLKQGHVTIQLGGYWGLQGKVQHINFIGAIGDQFSVSDNQDGNGLLGLGYYINGQEKNLFAMTYGLNAFYLAKTPVTGDITQEDLYTNLSYSYHLTHYPLYAMAKAAIKTKLPNFTLTLDAGIGPNFMQTSRLKEYSLDNGITDPDNAYSGSTNVVFSATVGAGVKFNNVFGTAPFECAYRFFYLGQGNFNKITNQLLTTLNTGSNYANAVMCSITV